MAEIPPKSERIAEFFRRLEAAPLPADFASARALVEATLNAVEDELSGAPFNPANWRTDGRMYPVQDDNVSDAGDGIQRLRSKGHDIFIGANGAIEIRLRGGDVVLSKPGADGRKVGE